MPQRLPAATYPALISLLAVTGMRVGEAIALTTSDFDEANGIVTVRSGKFGKFGKDRLLPLHPSTVAGLRDYVHTRNRLRPKGATDVLFSFHADPKHTFWYLSAAPELLALAADRLEFSSGQTA
jgi:integrase/recombinase XerD